ncbi:uncharacterized protein [Palaemon carinicauda]|uniref:uncharacterized protein n=1 Tax=Palaemon carinicauda TaxID=392227 RepID=UPI0035B5BA63
MEKSTSRNRDQGRKYKAGSVKRQEKADEKERVKKLPKITQWLAYSTVSAPEKSQIHTESGPSLNKPSTSVGASLNKPSAATASTERSEPNVVSAIDPERSEETQDEVKAMNTELLSIYDSFLAAHIKKHANKGSGHTSYLSHVISEEVIGIMVKKVMSSITDEVKTAKYFSVSVDSTPDISHMDQLSFTIRYVLPTTGPVERFLQFIPMLSHTGRDIATTVLDFLKEKNISVLDCRGQSYDNASNMSGKYQGTQQIIKNECSEAEYIPCMADSLNLVDTRWSARADAVAALSRANNENIIVLEEFSSDQNQPAETRAEASGLLKGLKKLETVILLEVWDTVLERFQSASIQLQKPGISLNTAVTLLESLLQFVKDLRSQFDDFEAKAIAKCDPSDVTGKVAYYADRQSQRIRKRKRQHDELDSVEDVTLTGRDMFRVTAF